MLGRRGREGGPSRAAGRAAHHVYGRLAHTIYYIVGYIIRYIMGYIIGATQRGIWASKQTRNRHIYIYIYIYDGYMHVLIACMQFGIRMHACKKSRCPPTGPHGSRLAACPVADGGFVTWASSHHLDESGCLSPSGLVLHSSLTYSGRCSLHLGVSLRQSVSS